MTAHITKKNHGYELAISPTFRAADAIRVLHVPGKREARKIAAEYNAKPWNF
jgi:hypothetical protein